MPQPLRRSQEWLLKRIQALGYDVNFEGMCYGISSMMIQANLLDDKKTYIERLTKMAAIPVTRFKETVEALPAQQKADIHAFCNGVVLYQDPHKFKHSVFENNQTNLAFNTNEAHSLLKPVALDDGARKIARLPPIQGAYQLSELQTYLRKLREHLGEVNFTAGIASEAHAMYLSYDGTQKQWFFLDPNAMPGETFTQVEEEKLAQTIEKGFSNHGTTIFTSTIYADNYAIESHLKHALPKLLSDGSWQALHQVSKDNALLKDSRNSSLLSLYCRDGNVKAIKELLPQLDKGELLKQNKRGNTAFNFAIYNDNKTLINLLLDKFSLTDLSADGLGRDLLTKACLDGSLNATEALLKRVDKATINTLYSDNQTFINAAIKGGKPELIDLFLAHGIDSDYLNKLDNNGWTPLMHACQTGAKSMVDKLLTHLTPEQINTFSDTSPLLLAAGSGNSELLKELLADERFSKQIDKTTPDGNNIFMAACQGGDVASVAILLQDQRFQSQVTAKNHAELSALDLAAAKGQQEIINQLLAANRGLNVQSALLTACKHGQLVVVKLLLNHDKYSAHELLASNEQGESALLAALDNPDIFEYLLNHPKIDDALIAQGGKLLFNAPKQPKAEELLELLLNHPKIDENHIKQLDRDGNTLLMQAIKARQTGAIKTLLTNPVIQAQINHKNQAGESALSLALADDDLAVAQAVFSNPLIMQQLSVEDIIKIASRRTGFYTVLTSLPRDILLKKTVTGKNALHLVCDNKENYYGVFNLINSFYGKELINQSDSLGETPLHKLAANKDCNISSLTMLIGKGAEVNHLNKRGESPLHLACRQGNLQLIKTLIEEGAKLDVKTLQGKTPLHYACESGNLEVAKYLIEKGCNINPQDKDGMNPLMLAAKKLDYKMVTLLLEKGADPNLFNKKGETALYQIVEPQNVERVTAQEIKKDPIYSSRNSQVKNFNSLVKYGAKVNLAKPNGKNVLALAQKSQSFLLHRLQAMQKGEKSYEKKQQKYLKKGDGDTIKEKVNSILKQYLPTSKYGLHRKRTFAESDKMQALIEKIKDLEPKDIKEVINQEIKGIKKTGSDVFQDRYYRHLRTAVAYLNSQSSLTKDDASQPAQNFKSFKEKYHQQLSEVKESLQDDSEQSSISLK